MPHSHSKHPVEHPATSRKVNNSTSGKLDKFAVVLSGICVIHCLMAPLILTLVPVFAINSGLEDILFHKLMLWIVLPTSAVALLIGCRKHKQLSIIATGIIGMGMLIVIAFWGHDLLSSTQEKLATSLAGIVLAFSHILNYRACRTYPCESDNCASEHHH